MRMRTALWLAAGLLLSLAAFQMGGAESYQGGPLADVNSPPPAWGLDMIGTPEEIGETWYDYQHNSSITRMIAYGPDGSIHCAWMKGMVSGVATNRHIYYNQKTPAGTWTYGATGTQIDTSLGAGYCTLDLDPAGNAYVAFHGPSPNNRVYVWSSATGIHILPMYPTTNPLVWPHIAVDDLGYIHIIAQTNPVGAIYRTRSTDGGVNWDAWTQIVTPAALASVSQTACAGPPGKVAMAWTQPSTGGVEVYYIESTDNGTNWGAPANMTNFAGGAHPDAANSRALYNVNLLYDNGGNLHAVYTTVQYPTATNGGKLWHWSQATGHRYITGTYVANAWTAMNPPGAWSVAIDKSALAQNAAGVLYVQWGQCTTPGDVSAANFGNWDVWATYSTDGGMNWMAPVNVTETATPGAPAGQCLSESWASMAKVATDKLHVQYIKDLDAGGVPQAQGTWTNNPVDYQGVPVDSIQTIMTVDLSASLPIVIPPQGGSFNYTVTITNTGYRVLHFDAWIDVTLPSGAIYAVLNRLGLALPPGGSIVRTLTQNVPGSAPAGNYTYWAHVGTFPWTGVVGKNIWIEDSFPFSKSGVDASGMSSWECSGWDNPEESLPVSQSVPTTHLVAQSYPNPFNPIASIHYALPEASHVTVSVYNVAGSEVAQLVNGWRQAGSHQVAFDGSNLASGVYLYQIKAGDVSVSGKMLLVK